MRKRIKSVRIWLAFSVARSRRLTASNIPKHFRKPTLSGRRKPSLSF
ncbi:UNVERIFIED_CONTAM: hypothetical protein GTU68_002786 [Idotea baltica]|nr:hypothetical protein [Idotea baltica]